MFVKFPPRTSRITEIRLASAMARSADETSITPKQTVSARTRPRWSRHRAGGPEGSGGGGGGGGSGSGDEDGGGAGGGNVTAGSVGGADVGGAVRVPATWGPSAPLCQTRRM